MIIYFVLAIIGIVLLIFAYEVYVANRGVIAVPAPKIERTVSNFGQGEKLKFAVMGDSSSAGQGGTYANGIAFLAAQRLAQDYAVEFLNTSVSGARTKDVLTDQLQSTLDFNPDILLVVIGSNDVTHLTSKKSLQNDLDSITTSLLNANCNTKIILTGSADVGSSPRIPQPLRYLAGQRVKILNEVFMTTVEKNNFTFAPVASKTGPIFRQNPSLFASDKFHPNDAGYKIWSAVINESLESALQTQPSHCKT